MTQTWKIYKATGKCGRAYIGLTKRSVKKRWSHHVSDAKAGKPWALQRAIKKYGRDWFSVETLCECYSLVEANMCERAMIAVHNTYTPNGFNLTIGGDGCPSAKFSDERNGRMAASLKELWNRPDRLAERRALMSSPAVRANKKAAMKIVAENMTPERREERRAQQAEIISKANRDPAVKHRQWANREYEKALASRIGYERSYKYRSDKGSHKPQSAESIEKMTRTKKCNGMWKSAMLERSRRAHERLGAL